MAADELGSEEVSAEELLAGPRGRRVCAQLVAGRSDRVAHDLSLAAHAQDRAAGRDRLRAALRRDPDLAAIAALSDPLDLLVPLADSVVFAMYWQPPDETDTLLADPELLEDLAPIAAALAKAPAARWWSSGLDRRTQHHVVWHWPDRDPPGDPPPIRERLHEWRSHADQEEREAGGRPDEVAWSGEWWSTPTPPPLLLTTRSLGPLDAVELLLEEDTTGWTVADVRPVTPEVGARVYEIAGPHDWAALVSTYPLEVSASRRHDWHRTTGRRGRWLIPDWERVATDHDAVHLTVAGYLATAGRALAVDGAATVLAGFAPDWTIWLADEPRPAGPARRWTRGQAADDDPLIGWAPVAG